jgi:hypothetical protein
MARCPPSIKMNMPACNLLQLVKQEGMVAKRDDLMNVDSFAGVYGELQRRV